MIILWIGLFLLVCLILNEILRLINKRMYRKLRLRQQGNEARERRLLEEELGIERTKLLEDEEE